MNSDAKISNQRTRSSGIAGEVIRGRPRVAQADTAKRARLAARRLCTRAQVTVVDGLPTTQARQDNTRPPGARRTTTCLQPSGCGPRTQSCSAPARSCSSSSPPTRALTTGCRARAESGSGQRRRHGRRRAGSSAREGGGGDDGAAEEACELMRPSPGGAAWCSCPGIRGPSSAAMRCPRRRTT